MRHLMSPLDFSVEELDKLLDLAQDIEAHPAKYAHACAGKKLATLFYEPSTRKEPSAIQAVSYFDAEETALTDFAGICVKSKNGRTDHIFSLSDATQTATYQGMKVKADYAVISNRYAGDNRTLFMGNGTQLIAPGVSIRTSVPAHVLLEQKQGKWYILSSASCTVVIGGKKMKVEAAPKTKRCISCP